MEFSGQEYWSGLPFPSPGDLPDPGIEPGSPALQADSLPSEPPGKPPTVWTIIFKKKKGKKTKEIQKLLLQLCQQLENLVLFAKYVFILY